MKNAVIDFIPGIAVDELAELLSAIAPLQKRADMIKDQLKATGMDRILGSKHEAVISLSERMVPDLDKIREHFRLTETEWKASQWVKASLATTLKVTARKVH